MCLPWCCWPFVDVELEEPPKKKEEKKADKYIMVEDGSVFYPNQEPQTAPVYYANYPNYYYPTTTPAPKVAEPKAHGNVYWYGSTKEEVAAQNHAIHKAHAKATPLVPYKPSAEQQFWCREHDKSYTLRTMTDIESSCKPGRWEMGSEGYPYFIRQNE
ncbi:hypothetical protein MMC19_001418 [Ptychographa xylographoides]|nr:hypothetical protein [Ptychographa xylographoides]